ncbi:hypothetical protein Hanom_Chr02g00130321 [Helianthus anomalus]
MSNREKLKCCLVNAIANKHFHVGSRTFAPKMTPEHMTYSLDSKRKRYSLTLTSSSQLSKQLNLLNYQDVF